MKGIIMKSKDSARFVSHTNAELYVLIVRALVTNEVTRSKQVARLGNRTRRKKIISIESVMCLHRARLLMRVHMSNATQKRVTLREQEGDGRRRLVVAPQRRKYDRMVPVCGGA